MRATLKLLILFYLSFSKCTDLDSYELNRIELTPIHDAIIFNDIAGIMNEFENSMNPEFDDTFSNSESDEDIENLLSEYQQYLDKAHDQTVNYIKKSKIKNKIPLIRREKFTKLKQIPRNNLDENNYNFADIKHPPAIFMNKFIPHANLKQVLTSDDMLNFLRASRDGKKLIDLPPTFPKASPELNRTCYCKENIIPCKCGCKQCVVYPNTFSNIQTHQLVSNSFVKSTKRLSENDLNNNNLNIRIKIDIQLPNMSRLNNVLKHRHQDRTEKEDSMQREITRTINLPFPYLNFPIPLELIGYKQNMFKDNSSPVHKITIHKKKKYRLSNNNKKHKNKKLTTPLFKLDPQMQQNITIEYYNNSESRKNNSIKNNEDVKLIKNEYENNETNTTLQTQKTTTIEPLTNKTSNQTLETFYLTLNISKENDNQNGDFKSENSIETDMSSDKDNNATLKPLRPKREIITKSQKLLTISNITATTSSYLKTKYQPTLSQIKTTKNIEKYYIADTELLYWPPTQKNQSLIHSKNITALKLDREIRKAKLNMTETNIRNNRTMALEKAIFGNVDWNDVGVVVPIFISFVGKYIKGVLTFCSESICHSMKCADKVCYHRICSLENRYNGIGHCTGNNDTDSVATMESIMDLPSNIAFEIVDILEKKLVGKMFGKITLCINTKCCTFAAFKKKFQKSKCSFKELTSADHCPNLKSVKII